MSDQASDPFRLEELARRREEALHMGGPAKIAKQHAEGRLTARERIEALLDPGTFQETALLAKSENPDVRDKTPADGKICGTGAIDGRPVFLHADDATVLAGSGGRVAMAKARKNASYAYRKGFPYVGLGEAGGVRMPDNMGTANMMRMADVNSGEPRVRRVPHIATLMGQCYGNPSWGAARADIVIMVKGGAMAVSGPKVLADATGEKVTAEELGGWELHAKVTGQVDLFADDDHHCLRLVRQALGYLPSNAEELPPVVATGDPPERSQEQILEVLPSSTRVAYDMRKILAVIFDQESLLELKPQLDGSLVTALARLDGHTVGVFANNPMSNAGALGPGACEKATSFICLCDSFHIPMVFFHDTPGFFVSKYAEERKMPLKIMTYLDALHQSTVPRIGVIVRKSYGMAHRNMVGARMGADYLVAWPTADVSFMAAEGAVNVVYGRKIAEADDSAAARAKYLDEINKMNEPWEAVGLNLIDDVIDPRDTRLELIRALKRARGPRGDQGRSRRLLANWPTGF